MPKTASRLASLALLLGAGCFTTSSSASTDLTGVVAIASGVAHTCALLTSGAVKCWGSNEAGQLGDGTTTTRLAPVAALNIPSGVTSIAAGGSSTCVRTNAGDVKCWGSISPYVAPGGGITAAAVSVGAVHACILTSVGGVKCWGTNSTGALGNGTTADSFVPVDVTGLTSGVLSVSAGNGFTCAVTSAKRIKCWGNNSVRLSSRPEFGPSILGTLGDGTNSFSSSTPVDVVDIAEDIASVHAATWDVCAVTAAGTVKCWGAFHNRPLDEAGLAGIAAATGAGGTAFATSNSPQFIDIYTHHCALATGGGVRCWDSSRGGNLGTGLISSLYSPPVDVLGLSSGVTALSSGRDFVCALTTSGRVLCWGAQGSGQLGDGKSNPDPAPVADVQGTAGVAQAVSAGGAHTCLRTQAGGIKCWGGNVNEQFIPAQVSNALGDGTTAYRLAPVDAIGMTSTVLAVSAGFMHTCGVQAGGAALCWGYNIFGQVGDGTRTNRSTAVPVSGLTSGVAAISGGQYHSCARMSDGTAKCWGFNSAGALGNNGTVTSEVPVAVQALPGNVVELAAGAFHTCARTPGQLLCWGSNSNGQLGDGTITDRLVATPVPDMGANVAAISAGGSHTCALLTTSAVKCWGRNDRGQVGDNTNQPHTSPTYVAGILGAVAISSGGDHSCAVTGPGGLKCWGSNASGQLGDGTRTDRKKPIDVPGFSSGVVAVSAGLLHTCVLMNTGAIRCFGDNLAGQLGNGLMAKDGVRPVPAPVAAGFDLVVTRVGTGSGTVTSNGPDISCGATCTATIASNTPVTLTAGASSGSVFSGWSGGGCSGTGTCQVTMTQAATVTASFALNSPLARPGNISTRGSVGTLDNQLIAGFIVGGSTNKTIVVNVAGPSLGAFGVTNALADPVVTLYRQSDREIVASNDDWQSQAPATVAALRASGLQPNHELEPALLVDVSPGAYTAVVSGYNGTTGVGLVGVFEVDHPESPLTNISTRGEVLTGGDVMIGGFVIQGSSAQRVVVSVAGPSLASFGIPNPLANPTLAIVRSSDQSIIASNDDWQAQANQADVAAIQATGFQPNHPLEPAVLLDLPPGAYTAIVQGAFGTTGVGLVGVFAVP